MKAENTEIDELEILNNYRKEMGEIEKVANIEIDDIIDVAPYIKKLQEQVEEVKQVVENEYRPLMKQLDKKMTDLVKENEELKKWKDTFQEYGDCPDGAKESVEYFESFESELQEKEDEWIEELGDWASSWDYASISAEITDRREEVDELREKLKEENAKAKKWDKLVEAIKESNGDEDSGFDIWDYLADEGVSLTDEKTDSESDEE